jgi:hypothetical protein
MTVSKFRKVGYPMAYRLFLRSKRNKLEYTERVVVTETAEKALEVAAFNFNNWTVEGIEAHNG